MVESPTNKLAACILCACPDTQLVRSIPLAELRRGWARLGVAALAGPGQAALLHLRCPRCTLEFFAPPLVGDGAFYQALARHDWYYMGEKWEHDEALADIGPGERVLEVGAGEGAFLERLRRASVRAVGLELNEEAARRGASRGLDLRPVPLEQFAEDGPGFDVVCSFQVLEHVAEPRQFLGRCLGLLRPGGRLILSTPNQDSPLLRQMPSGLLNMPPHHQSRWGRRAYSYAADMLGARLLRVSAEPLALYHAGMAAHGWLNRLAGLPADLPGDGGGARPLPLRLLLAAGVRLGALALRPAALRRRIAGHSLYVVLEKTGRGAAPEMETRR